MGATDRLDEPARANARGSWFACVVVVATVVAYLPTFTAYPVADDLGMLTHPPWEGVFMHIDKGSFYRPLPALAMWSEGAVWGFWPFPMRVTRMVLHLACAVLCGVLAGRLVSRRGVRETAALAFAVHPVHAGAVAWLSGIFDVMFTLFALLCVWAYDGYRVRGGRGWYVAAVASLVAALLSKEHAVSVAPLLVIWALVRFGWTRVVTLVPFVVVVAGYVAIRLHYGVEGPGATGVLPGGVGEVLRGTIVEPIRLMVVPVGDVLLGSWAGAVRAAFVVAAVLAVTRAVRVDARGTSWALAVFVVALVVATLPVASRVLEGMGPAMGRSRFLYLPSVVLCVLAGVMVGGASRALVAPIAVLFVFGTYVHARAWHAAGDVSRSVVEGIEATFPTFGVDDPVLLVESMPRTHMGIITLGENGLENALRARRPEIGELDVIAPTAAEAWPRDVREVVDAERSFAVRWDRESQELVDRTSLLRELIGRVGDRSVAFDEMALGEWRVSGEQLGEAPVVVPVDGRVVLESESVPIRTRRVVVLATGRGEAGSEIRVSARWWTRGDRGGGYRAESAIPCDGVQRHHTVGTYLLGLDELDAEGMSVRVELVGEGGELEIEKVLTAY